MLLPVLLSLTFAVYAVDATTKATPSATTFINTVTMGFNATESANDTFHLSIDDDYDSDEYSEYEPAPAYAKIKQYKGDVLFSAEDRSCGWWNKTISKYEQPALEFAPFNFNCLADFHWRAFAPACGDTWYEKIKYCAMVKFYKNKKPAEGGINDENKNMMLLMADGCMVCPENDERNNNQSAVEATVRVQYTLPSGSFFTSCSEETKTGGKLRVKLGDAPVNVTGNIFMEVRTWDDAPIGTEVLIARGERHFGSFAVPAILYQRECNGLFGVDPIMQAFQQIQLVVEHNCKGSNHNPIKVNLADLLDPRDFQDNLAEVRGLYIDLKNGVAKQYNLVDFRYLPIRPDGDGEDSLKMAEWANKKNIVEDSEEF